VTEVPGAAVQANELWGSRSKELVGYLLADHSPYLRFVECRRKGDLEVIVCDVHVEVAPRRPVRVARTERLMLLCAVSGNDIPLVVPVRADFPVDQLHITIHHDCDFASLCLWATPVEDLKARFTPFMFFARIKEWLELAAEGRLHQPGQPAEPVLGDARVQAILPAGPIKPEVRSVAEGEQGINKRVTIRFSEVVPGGPTSRGPQRKFVLIPVTTETVIGRAVRSAPRTLDQLVKVLAGCGCDLIKSVTDFVTTARADAGLADAWPVILVTFPKATVHGEASSEEELWAFATDQTIAELGNALGTFGTASGFTVPILGAKASDQELPKIALEPMAVLRELALADVSKLSGMEGGESLQALAIGVGALGSRVLDICIRGGFGRWRILDMDTFLPHNAVRHILGDWAIGQHKAPHVGLFLNQAVPGEPIAATFVADVTDAAALPEAAAEALKNSDLIVDMSASVAVSRTLALNENASRCVSLFFNPSASDLVMLAEDSKRACSLLDLEASYYAELTSNAALAGHLDVSDERGVRFGNGCRDVTARISPDKVAILGGLAVQGLRSASGSSGAVAKVWRTMPDGAVRVVELPTPSFRSQRLGDWDVRWSDNLVTRLSAQRCADLPNETGGILLGLVDFERRQICVSDAIDPPPDSVKKPHYFERGKTGLEARLKGIGQATAGQLRYVGEWHSHPDGCAATPSDDDDTLFAALAGLFRGTGEPYIMSIVSEAALFWRFGLNGEANEACLELGSKVL
jgi:integrative and conjugative element protein (TIGR02256 family)